MENVIAVVNMKKSYGQLQALNDVSFQVQRGEVFGLLGANGAGKSTTLECILGVRRPDSGQALLLGQQADTHRKELFEHVGVQFQEASYQDNITVAELCAVTRVLYKNPADTDTLLRLFGLADKKKSTVGALSGGLKQRLFIVLALLPNPEVVFLDELTTGLDPRARRDVWSCLLEMKKKGLTILLTSHFMDEVEVLCDRICILKHGRVRFLGTVSQATEESPFDSFEDAYLWYSDEIPPDLDVNGLMNMSADEKGGELL